MNSKPVKKKVVKKATGPKVEYCNTAGYDVSVTHDGTRFAILIAMDLGDRTLYASAIGTVLTQAIPFDPDIVRVVTELAALKETT